MVALQQPLPPTHHDMPASAAAQPQANTAIPFAGTAAPIGVLPHFAAPQPTVLVMKERGFLTGDDFSVEDSNGVTVCKVNAKHFTLHQSKEFLDAGGSHLFTVKKKIVSLHGSHEGYATDGSLLFEVKGKFKIGGSKMIASFTNAADKKPIEITVRGDWIDRKAEMIIEETGMVAATITRQFMNLREAFRDKQTYFVEVQPGVDLVLITALAVVFDERNNEK